MDDWKWDGTLWDFVEIVQWAFVFKKLSKEHHEDCYKIVTDPKKKKKKAEEYGMTLYAISKEMVEHGNEAIEMLELIEKRKRAEQDESNHRR